MQIRRFVTPLTATILTVGALGLTAAPSVSASADTGWGRRPTTQTVLADTGWGKSGRATNDTGWGRL